MSKSKEKSSHYGHWLTTKMVESAEWSNRKICKNILLFSLTFTFCRLCQCGLGGNEAAFANTSSIHFKSSQRQKCQISIWIKCARVWFIYSLKSIISFCKPNITNCLETSKEFRIILEENRFLFWDTVLNWIQSE